METIQDLFKKTKREWIDEARDIARELLQQYPYITIEDVLKLHPLPTYLHHNTIGAVFRDTAFTTVGFTLARKPSSKGRTIRQWRLK